ncbi:hypothetical protein ACFYVL_19730 [Streptomyces sp. NPDC004111]|uniref:hypothetical protein n=1 Tax=Streptomyces sp. NPDC004111 TaxID=3364690 RepID=UPI0036A4089C
MTVSGGNVSGQTVRRRIRGQTVGQRIVRMALVAAGAVLALLLLLATCGGGQDGGGAKDAGKDGGQPAKAATEAPPATPRLAAPAAYDNTKGWRIVGGSAEYALAQEPALVAHVERSGADRFVLRAYDARTGRTVWSGEPWRSLSDPAYFPKLLTVTKGDRRFFVTWSYGKVSGADALSTGDSVVALDMYDARDGSQQHTELPWPGVPVVSGTGPGILLTDGAATATVVDPETGRPTAYTPKDLGAPKGCKNCGVRTEVRGLTAKGLLVGGRTEFWVKGGWYSRSVAPKGTDPVSGLPTSVTATGQILAKWQKKKPDGWDRWAVHDAATGKVLASVDCRKPAIEPGTYPQAVTAPGGQYLVAGNLAFDLRTPAPKEATTGHCLQEKEGSRPVTLTSVTDDGIAYGTTSPTSAAGTPVEVPLATGAPVALKDTAVPPETELAGTGLFRWTDRRERPYLIGYPRR